MNAIFNRKTFLIMILALVVLVCLSTYLDARVGGGHKYSGSRSKSGGSGGGSGGDGLGFLIYLVFRYPKIGIPLLIIVAILYFRAKSKNPEPDHTLSSLDSIEIPAPPPAATRETGIASLQNDDKYFSLPLFMDFAQLLYTNVKQFAANHKLDKIAFYLTPYVQKTLAGQHQQITGVRDIIVGNCTITGINLADPNENFITLSFETNYEETIAGKARPAVYYERAIWVLARQKGVQSKGPGQINSIGCTKCGGALDDNTEGKCPFCGFQSVAGTVTWYVKSISILERSSRGPDISGGYADEVGTGAITLFQPGLDQKMSAFKEKYPDFQPEAFFQRVRFIFQNLQEAWSSQEFEKARPYETDYLFQTHLYWINLYKKERMRNVLKNIQVDNVQLVSVGTDAYYDSLTVRIHASMIDYTETYNGKLTGGNPNRARPFSEYWTFIRRTGVQKPDTDPKQCPNCAAPLSIGMAGKCEYCGSKITTGDFSWVLSRIEQDESYRG